MVVGVGEEDEEAGGGSFRLLLRFDHPAWHPHKRKKKRKKTIGQK